MPEIQDADITAKLVKRFGLKAGSIAPTLSPELVPVVLVADLTSPVEESSAYMRVAMGTAVIPGVAAKFGQSQLFNPKKSGVVAMVEVVDVSIETAGPAQITTHDTAVGSAVSTVAFRDRRIPGLPATQVRSQTDAGVPGSTIWTGELPAAEVIRIPIAMILGPGNGLVFANSRLDDDLRVSWSWFERAVLPGE